MIGHIFEAKKKGKYLVIEPIDFNKKSTIVFLQNKDSHVMINGKKVNGIHLEKMGVKCIYLS